MQKNMSGSFLEEIDEKAVLIAIVGSLETVKRGAITINEAEKFLFSPYMVKKLKQKQCNEKIVELIELGCELEDVYSLIPNEVYMVIDNIKEAALKLLEGYKEYSEEFWITE